MSIKLIVTDMDGTLLNENIEVTNRAREAILKAQNAGIDFAVATGRTVESGYSLIKEQGITCPFIELNGARLFDENERLQFTRQMKKDDVKTLVDILNHYDVHNQFITQEGTYTNRTMEDYILSFKAVFKNINKSLTEEEAAAYATERMEKFKVNMVDNYDFLHLDTGIQVLKSMANAGDDLNLLREVQNTVEEELPDLIVTSASTLNIEINHVHANKGKAVAEYAESKGYSADEVITIGDNINDLTMLEWSNHSYAVANGHDFAKEAANYIAPSHADDAVAQIIERVVGEKSLVF